MAEKVVRVKVDATGARRETQQLQKDFKATATQASAMNSEIKNASGGLSSIRGVAQSAGYQLQDVAVQLQAGTDAFVVLGQQGSQFASAFGPGGAVIGAIIAVGAAMVGVLAASSDTAKKSIDELIESADELGEAQKALLQVRLGDEISELIDPAAEAAAKVTVLTQNLNEQRKILKRLNDGTARGWLTDLVLSSEDVEKKISDLERELIDANASLEEIEIKTNKYRKALESLRDGTLGAEGAQKKLKEAFDDIVGTYSLQTRLLGKSEKEQAKIIAKSRLGAEATDKQRQEVESLIDAYYKEKKAIDDIENSKKKQKDRDSEKEREERALESWFEKIGFYNMSATELNDAWRASELEKLKEWQSNNLEKEEEYRAAKNAIDKKWADKDKQIRDSELKAQEVGQKRVNTMVAQSNMDLARQSLSFIEQTSEEGSILQKAAFLGAQALAVSQALMNAEVAATSALLPPPIGLGPIAGQAMSATIRNQGYASAALIGAQTISGLASRQTGGYMNSNTPYQVGGGAHTSDPEMYTSGGKQYLIDSSAGKMTRLDKSSGGNQSSSFAVTVNNMGEPMSATARDGGVDETGVRRMIIDLTPDIVAQEMGDRNSKSNQARTRWERPTESYR